MKRFITVLTLILSLCLVLSLGAIASGEPSGESSGEASGEILPGTYTDGDNVLVIADDGTFSMETVGQNMEGEDFTLTVTGHVEDGAFVIDGVFDGDINLIDLATEEQLAGNLATVEAVYPAASASGEPAGDFVLEADGSFILKKTGQNMEGEEFALTVTGHVEADGSVVIEGLYDGEFNLIDLATEEQLAADMASVQAALAG